MTTDTPRCKHCLPPHPDQPLVRDEVGTIRFRENKIVRYLLDAGPFDMNALSVIPFDNEDRAQFAQLIGYSVSGFGDLPYSDPERVALYDEAAEKLP